MISLYIIKRLHNIIFVIRNQIRFQQPKCEWSECELVQSSLTRLAFKCISVNTPNDYLYSAND